MFGFQFSLQILKPSFIGIFYGLATVTLLHLFRKKTKEILTATILAFLASFVVSMVFYRLNPLVWIEETHTFGLYLIGEIKGGAVSLATVVGIIAVFLSLPLFITERLEKQELRSFYHFTYGILIVYFLYLEPAVAFYILSISFSLFIFLEYFRQSDDTSDFTNFIKRVMNKAMRDSEVRGYMATIFYLIGLLLVVMFLPSLYAIGCTLILAFGDPTAVVVGQRFGKHKWNYNPKKTIEGSLAMFIVIIITLLIIGIPLLTTAFAAAGATLFESLDIKIGDNLIIPIVSGIIMITI